MSRRANIRPSSPPPAIAREIERQVADDRAWFEQHPGVSARVRPPFPYEFFPKPVPPGGFVLVRQVRPGFRWRQHFARPSGTPRDWTCLYDRTTGAVLEEIGGRSWQ